MKRLGTLAGLAFAALVSAFAFSAPAHAVTLTPVTNNGITCQRHDGGNYPENGHFYDCTTVSPMTAYAGYALSQFQATLTQFPTYVKPDLQGQPVELFVFDDAISYVQYSTAGSCCTTAQKQAAYNQFVNLTGVSVLPTGSYRAIIVWAMKGTGTYPNETQVGSSYNKNTTAHETGHNYDWIVGTPSGATQMDTLANKDKAYMQAHDPNYSTDIVTYGYWLVKDSSKAWAELFAEEFAKRSAGQVLPVDGIIQSYWQCTKFNTEHWMSNGTGATATDFTNGGLSRCN